MKTWLALLFFVSAPVAAEGRRQMTIDWIFSDEGEAIAKKPDAEWTADGDVLVFDGRRPKA